MVGCSPASAPNSRNRPAPDLYAASPKTDVDTDAIGKIDRCPPPEDFRPEEVEIRSSGLDVVAWHANTGDRNELVVFLHGRKGWPDNNKGILRTAAYAGYRAIGLQHRTVPSVVERCEGVDAEDFAECVEETHAAKIYGSEHGAYLNVPDYQSVVSHLHRRLVRLDQLYPNEGWSVYFETMPPLASQHENYIHWDQIIVGGFSAGAGDATMMARDLPLRGVVLHSGPVDQLDWVSEGQTPGDSHFAFRHADEERTEEMRLNAGNLNIPGEPYEFDPNRVGLTWDAFVGLGTQQFVSALEPHPACEQDDPVHSSMARTDCMNVDDAKGEEPYGLVRPYLYAYFSLGTPHPGRNDR